MKFCHTVAFLVTELVVCSAIDLTWLGPPEPSPTPKAVFFADPSGTDAIEAAVREQISIGGIDERKIKLGKDIDADLECPFDVPLADYYYVKLKAGVEYSMEVDRVDCQLDPTLVLYGGLLTGPPIVDPFVGIADDNDLVPPHCNPTTSPFADPLILFTPSETGIFTLGVISFFSGACDGNYEYTISVNAVTPAPSISLAPSRMPSGAPSGAPSISLAPSLSAAPSTGKGGKSIKNNIVGR